MHIEHWKKQVFSNCNFWKWHPILVWWFVDLMEPLVPSQVQFWYGTQFIAFIDFWFWLLKIPIYIYIYVIGIKNQIQFHLPWVSRAITKLSKTLQSLKVVPLFLEVKKNVKLLLASHNHLDCSKWNINEKDFPFGNRGVTCFKNILSKHLVIF